MCEAELLPVLFEREGNCCRHRLVRIPASIFSPFVARFVSDGSFPFFFHQSFSSFFSHIIGFQHLSLASISKNIIVPELSKPVGTSKKRPVSQAQPATKLTKQTKLSPVVQIQAQKKLISTNSSEELAQMLANLAGDKVMSLPTIVEKMKTHENTPVAVKEAEEENDDSEDDNAGDSTNAGERINTGERTNAGESTNTGESTNAGKRTNADENDEIGDGKLEDTERNDDGKIQWEASDDEC
ncbi:hypothetical protein BJ508DRAFT_315908 [Ascobolus immersus RN42]|uniref:Uncharacterized protein n=1 Tax=Ascobolus immersus RN42 TaxID=1160509 RepID=A0A3N4H8P8_ASCIM|nr:hypothetical protein BJ508DRAFT_315908 [Ascobolus immersus RN42]